MSCTTDNLSTPLLLDDDNNKNNDCMRDVKRSNNDDDENTTTLTEFEYLFTWSDFILTVIVCPFILCVEFAIAFAVDNNGSLDPRLHLFAIIRSIIILSLSCHLYRRAVMDFEVQNIIFVLLPKGFLNGIALLVLLNQIYWAYIFLLVTTLVLNGFVLVTTAAALFSSSGGCDGENEHEDEDDDDDDEDESENIIAVGQRPTSAGKTVVVETAVAV